jgi:hypothetical protein
MVLSVSGADYKMFQLMNAKDTFRLSLSRRGGRKAKKELEEHQKASVENGRGSEFTET